MRVSGAAWRQLKRSLSGRNYSAGTTTACGTKNRLVINMMRAKRQNFR